MDAWNEWLAEESSGSSSGSISQSESIVRAGAGEEAGSMDENLSSATSSSDSNRFLPSPYQLIARSATELLEAAQREFHSIIQMVKDQGRCLPSTWPVPVPERNCESLAEASTRPRGRPRTFPKGHIFRCPMVGCHKTFKGNFQLETHMRVHTGETPFLCYYSGCDKAFKWRSSLESHMQSHKRNGESGGGSRKQIRNGRGNDRPFSG